MSAKKGKAVFLERLLLIVFAAILSSCGQARQTSSTTPEPQNQNLQATISVLQTQVAGQPALTLTPTENSATLLASPGQARTVQPIQTPGAETGRVRSYISDHIPDGPQGVYFIQWSEVNGQITGDMRAFEASDVEPRDMATQLHLVLFTGAIDGTEIKFSFFDESGTSIGKSSRTYSGTIQGRTLTLNAPEPGQPYSWSFTAASLAEYYSTLTTFSQSQRAPGPTPGAVYGYLADTGPDSTSGVYFIQWSQLEGQLAGDFRLIGHLNPDDVNQAVLERVVGSRDGSNVYLTISYGESNEFTGTIDGDSLILHGRDPYSHKTFSSTFSVASEADYDKALAAYIEFEPVVVGTPAVSGIGQPPPPAVSNMTITGQQEVEFDKALVLSLSPDGQWLLTYKNRQEICLNQVSPQIEKWCVPWPSTLDLHVSWSPDSQRVAFTEDAARIFHKSHIWVLDLNERQLSNLTEDGLAGDMANGDLARLWQNGKLAQDLSPAWSPDGQKIVFARTRQGETSRGTELDIIPATGGEPRKLVELPNLLFAVTTPIFWSQDGHTVIFSVGSSSLNDPAIGIYAINSDGQNFRKLHAPPDASRPYPEALAVSAGGDRVLIRYRTPGMYLDLSKLDLSSYAILDVQTRQAVPIKRTDRVEGLPIGPSNAAFSPDGKQLLAIFRQWGSSEMVVRDLGNQAEYVLAERLPSSLGYGAGPDVAGLQWANNDRIWAVWAPRRGVLYSLGR